MVTVTILGANPQFIQAATLSRYVNEKTNIQEIGLESTLAGLFLLKMIITIEQRAGERDRIEL